MEKPPCIVFVPSAGMGHLIPLVQFAKTLLTKHNLSATFIVPNDGPLSNSQLAFLDSLPKAINYVILPPVDFQDLPAHTKIETRISLMVTRSVPSIREAFNSMIVDKKIVALFVDIFGTDAFEVAIKFSVPKYVFFPAAAMTLSLLLHMPELDQMVSCEYKDLPDPFQLPGCIPLHGKDFLDPLQDRKNDAYKWTLHNAKNYMLADGIVINSFKELEGGAIEALQEKQPGKPPVYPVGPLIQAGSVEFNRDVNGCSCLRWLDDQPRESVLYICFGSGGTLSSDQVTELAMGLELSEQRFIWVIKTPNDRVADAEYFHSNGHNNSLDFLPHGFLERTKDRGLVVPTWAPQAQILSHGSTGGFLTHCGWNSVLETVVQGVPMIAWPLYAEQKMNALMLTQGLKVALRVKLNENGIVDRLEITRVVKGLLEGEEGKRIKIRIQELKEAAANVLTKDGGSAKTLDQLAYTLINKI